MRDQFVLSRRHMAGALVAGVLLAVLSASGVRPAAAQSNLPPLRLSMVALDLEGGGAVPMQVVIERWTSDAENERLMQVLMKDGQRAYLDALNQVKPKGYLRSLQSLGWDIRLARQTKGKDGGLEVTLVTDRPLGFAESWYQTRSVDYPFTVMNLTIPNEGEGTGSLSVATKLIPDPTNKILVIEGYGNQRVRLVQIKRER